MIGAGINDGRAFQGRDDRCRAGGGSGAYMIPIVLLSIVCGLVTIVFSVQIIHTAVKK
ncbi:MAG: hypothetical protein ACE5K0_12810 [Candidatus Methanofastidiosia archaeon]